VGAPYFDRNFLGDRNFAPSSSSRCLDTTSLVGSVGAWNSCNSRAFQHYCSCNYHRIDYFYISMTTINQKKSVNNKNVVGSVMVGVAGAAVIAGAAVAATMAMKDDKTREKVKKALIKAKDQAIDYFDTFKSTDPSTRKEANPIKKIASDIKSAVKKRI
jgi:hypothetical protein